MSHLRRVRLSWFRGAADEVVYDILTQSIVIYGENAAGKSSFVDAIECLISGKCDHLNHEYSGTNQEKGLVNTHKPAHAVSAIEASFADGSTVSARLGASRLRVEGTAVPKVEAWNYRRTILRQDEIASFIKASKGEKYSALLPLLGLAHLEHAAENVRQLSRGVSEKGALKLKTGLLSAALDARRATFGEKSDAEVAAVVADIHARYVGDDEVDAQRQQLQASEAIANIQSKFSSEERSYNALKKLAGFEVNGYVEAVRGTNARVAELTEPLVQERLAVVNAARTFASSVDGELECPACGSLVAAEELRSHLATETNRLKEIQEAQNLRALALASFCDEVFALKRLWGSPDLETWRDDPKQKKLAEQASQLESLNLTALRQACAEVHLNVIEKIAAEISSAAACDSSQAPSSVQALHEHSRVLEAANKVWSVSPIRTQIEFIETSVAFLNELERRIREEIRRESKAVFQSISADIQRLWDQFHPDKKIDEVRLHAPFDADKAIDIAIRFHGVDQVSPRLTLSEGYRNSLGLCIFLALSRREAKVVPIILDDVVVSLDRNHRGMLADILETEFKDRQVIVLTHDREWYVELTHLLSRPHWSFEMLMPWQDPGTGIRFMGSSNNFDVARSHLYSRPDSAGNDARKIMDTELPIIAERLKTRLPYRRGMKNDQRTGIDFISQLISDAGKAFQVRVASTEFQKNEAGVSALDDAKRRMIAWGNRSSHTFELARPEATKLIDACEKALHGFKCASCQKYVWSADTGNSEILQCQCGELRWRYGKA